MKTVLKKARIHILSPQRKFFQVITCKKCAPSAHNMCVLKQELSIDTLREYTENSRYSNKKFSTACSQVT